KRIKMQNDKVRSVIQNLTEEQSMVLCAALNEGRKYVVTSKQFPYISELIELGVLNKTFPDGMGSIYYSLLRIFTGLN
ncbi:super-infection exclusion protein B, partial [Desulfovibrio piger]|uniref:super-infection exclusion protein B n=1 Tax=Desulfovibrio piger TaxID=901 RepID=UPI001FE61CB1